MPQCLVLTPCTAISRSSISAQSLARKRFCPNAGSAAELIKRFLDCLIQVLKLRLRLLEP